MPPKIDLWTTVKENLLIELVKSCPLLWDVSLPEYRRNDLKEVHWDRISLHLGPNFKVDVVKKRWSNMKGTFQENHRKVENSKRSGASADSVYQPRWILYKKLSFLDSAMRCGESESNLAYPEPNQAPDIGVMAAAIPVPPLSVTQYDNREPQIYFDENLQAYTVIPSDLEGTTDQNTQKTLHLSSSTTSSTHEVPCSSSFARPPDVLPRLVTPVPLESPPPRPSSAPSGTTLFTKRGATKSANLNKEKDTIEEVLTVMKQVANEPVVMPTKGRAEAFGSYVASVLKTLSTEQQQHKELKIMEVLFSND